MDGRLAHRGRIRRRKTALLNAVVAEVGHNDASGGIDGDIYHRVDR